MKISLLTTTDPLWSSTLSKHHHDFYHLPGYVKLEAERLRGEPFAFLAQEGEYFFFLPMIVRPLTVMGKPLQGYEKYKDAVSPYGYPCPLAHVPLGKDDASEFFKNAFDLLKREMLDRGICCAFARLHPLIDSNLEALATCGVVVEHAETVWIDLTLDESELRRQTRSTYRNNIKNMKKDGLCARVDESWEHIGQFVDIYDETMENVDAEDWYHFGRPYFEKLKEELGLKISLCIVQDGDYISSAGLFTECCGLVQYHLSGSNPESRHRDTTKIMLDFVRWWAKKRGNKQFHLGGGIGAKADNLFFFKSGFSKLRSTFYSWRIIFDSEVYDAAIEFWKELAQEPADDIQGFFPPYRKPLPNKSVKVHD